jgi:lysyl-tRNA synthetase, class I
MFWGDRITEQIKDNLRERIESGEPLVIRDEKTASGRIHVGSMRGVAVHGIISEILNERGIADKFLYEINDFDPMDSLPSYLDEKKYGEYMGKPLYSIPSPDNKAKNYAEYFAQEFIDVIEDTGFHPAYYRASELYKSGKMNDAIKIALEKADTIREIYKKVSGSVKSDDWLPFNVVCEKCGKIGTTKVTSFDGAEVSYTCGENIVEWAKGCRHEGTISPFDGNGKLPWKVDWAAKFAVMNVDIEGAGKDHSTKGGARDIAEHISREVFEHEPPFNIPYEFFLVGGRKMSSSKGEGSSARDIADLLPRELFRLALIGKDIKQAVDFIPDGDTIPVLYDTYDRIAEKYWNNTKDDDARVFELIHLPEDREKIEKRFLPRFSQVAFLAQMPHIDIENEVEKIKGEPLTDSDKKELESRAKYAKNWLLKYAPEEYKYELQKDGIPQPARSLSDVQKNALSEVLEYVKLQKKLDGQELHTQLHEIRKKTGIGPKEFFSAIYLSFLGKDSGPKAGWFLSVLDREFLEKRLEEVA